MSEDSLPEWPRIDAVSPRTGPDCSHLTSWIDSMPTLVLALALPWWRSPRGATLSNTTEASHPLGS